jgi:hypothetical protein
MTTMTRGIQTIPNASSCARSTRKASDSRASETNAVNAISHQKTRGTLPIAASCTGFPHTEREQADGDECRYDGDPQHPAQITRPQPEEQHGQQRASDGPHGVERLAQAKCRIAQRQRCHVGHDGVARCAADPFADAVNNPGRDDTKGSVGQRKHRLRQRCQAIAQQCQRLAPGEAVRDEPRHHLEHRCRRLGKTFDEADDENRQPHDGGEIQRQHGMDQLG